MHQVIPPDHMRVSPRRIGEVIGTVLSTGGPKNPLVVTDSSYPDGAPFETPSLTPWPFLLLPLRGTMRVAYMAHGRLLTRDLRGSEPVLYAPNTWACVERDPTRTLLRATFADDGILLGVRDWGNESGTRKTGAGRLELSLLPGGVPSRIAALLGIAFESDVPFADLRAAQALTLILTELVRMVRDPPGGEPAAGSKAAATWIALREYLRHHAHESPSRDDTARALGITSRHVSRLCRELGHRSYLDMLDELRIERARSLLAGSHMTVKEVAFACGFGSVSYFIRVFRKRVGVTPVVWRRGAN
ncbi:MAG: helix-turn-helix domain-containing protein [Chitinivibrionales bacterium]|nr:helix-turn-helix domain-containing protein [Chitinivibrionales bacterium]